jgi:hypothetical protein
MNAFNVATLITSVMVLAALVLHFYYRKKNRSEAELELLNTFASEHESTISMYDILNRVHIGIDNQGTHKLFFIRSTPDHEVREVIDLATVRNCLLDRRATTYSNNKDKVGIIEKIDLIFTFMEAGKPALRLEFYNNDYDALTLSGELQLAMNWEEIVSQAISGILKKEPAVPVIDHPGVTAMTG